VRPPKKKLLEWSKQIVTWSPSPNKRVQALLLSTIALMRESWAKQLLQQIFKTPQGYQRQHFAEYGKGTNVAAEAGIRISIVHKLAAVEKVWMVGVSSRVAVGWGIWSSYSRAHGCSITRSHTKPITFKTASEIKLVLQPWYDAACLPAFAWQFV
jgi:hypothetical protein